MQFISPPYMLTNNQFINNAIIAFINKTWERPADLANLSDLAMSKEYNSFGVTMVRQSGKTTTLLHIFNTLSLTANVVLLTKSSHTKKNYLNTVNSEFKTALESRIFTKIKDMENADFLFPNNGKRNLVLLDDFTVDGFFAAIYKEAFDLKLTVLSMST